MFHLHSCWSFLKCCVSTVTGLESIHSLLSHPSKLISCHADKDWVWWIPHRHTFIFRWCDFFLRLFLVITTVVRRKQCPPQQLPEGCLNTLFHTCKVDSSPKWHHSLMNWKGAKMYSRYVKVWTNLLHTLCRAWEIANFCLLTQTVRFS